MTEENKLQDNDELELNATNAKPDHDEKLSDEFADDDLNNVAGGGAILYGRKSGDDKRQDY
jgi:hypothetical protein